MRVLQVSKFFPPVWGGIEAAAWEVSEGLARLGVRADVLCSNQRFRTEREQQSAGYEVVRAASLGRLQSTSISPVMAWHLRRMAQPCDVLHVHMPDPMAAAAVWAVRPRARLVLHWHSDVVKQRHAMRVYEPLQSWLLARADAVIATSQAYADASVPLQPWRHKVAVIPIGISDNHSPVTEDSASALRQQYRGRKLVFALGRMTYYKGFEVLIEAAAQLPEDVAVLIGGGGQLLPSLKSQVAARGLAGKVHMLGHIPDEFLPAYFEACDVFCLPSTARSEAYGIAMVEAMLMSRPIVASEIDGSGVPWVNQDGETGFNVATGNPQALAAALTRLMASAELRKRFGTAARRRYENEFSASLMTERTLRLYRRILETP